ncbi:DUF2958 domain-containing protein [Bradyrhizobium sp. HKCCYLS2058]|uniref:DUF2958 domain-containing protein n=1 Tax=unclassified Bradyrhizobium TaxID=2631580 RepID=UPI003EBE1A94
MSARVDCRRPHCFNRAIAKGPLGLTVERDADFIGDKPLSAYFEKARAEGRIVTS